jgi:putative ABC transport system ATP-binding protein
MNPTLQAREVSKAFGTGSRHTPVLRGISMEVFSGETVFLIGPSGSGKTTLLSILGCILTPDQGSLRVLGQEVGRLQPEELAAFRRQHLGFIFQSFNLFPTLSALDNLCLALTMRQMPLGLARKRAAELLDQVDLGHRARQRPAQLSSGECQRVAVARALANDPTVLFADEPTASLDAENGQAVMQLLTRLVRDRGATLVVVTHDNRILPFADRILKVEDGRLAGTAEPTGGADPAGRATGESRQRIRIANPTLSRPDPARWAPTGEQGITDRPAARFGPGGMRGWEFTRPATAADEPAAAPAGLLQEHAT